MASLNEGAIEEVPRKRDFNQIERRLPGRREPQVGVALVVPVVVDVQTLGIEVADVHAIAVRVERIYPFPSESPDREGYRRGFPAFLYPLDPECIVEAVPCWTSSPETGKKLESLSCFAHYPDP